MMGRVGMAVVFVSCTLSMVFAQYAMPQEACKAENLGKKSLTAQEVWKFANERALKWQADAVPYQFTTTSSGPLDSNGASTDWSIQFSSEAAGAVNMISISSGKITCYSHQGGGGRVIQMSDDIVLDTKRLYDQAQKSGGEKYTAQGFTITAGLVQNPLKGQLWYLNYHAPEGKKGSLSVIFDAKTGEISNVFED